MKGRFTRNGPKLKQSIHPYLSCVVPSAILGTSNSEVIKDNVSELRVYTVVETIDNYIK